MPIPDGFGASPQLRNTEGFRDVVIIAMFVSVFEETRKRALHIGFHDFLFKPIERQSRMAKQILSTLDHLQQQDPKFVPLKSELA